MPFDWSLLAGTSVDVAPRLLGCYLVRQLDGQRLVGRIIETEAYDQTDAASHSFIGAQGRAAVTFGPPGHLYVHASRHHFLCDITTGQEGYGSSVLIRAIEPLEGLEIMRALRRGAPPTQLTNGPAKVCQALAIDAALNGHNLQRLPLKLLLQAPISPDQILQTTRIGITKEQDMPWRFCARG